VSLSGHFDSYIIGEITHIFPNIHGNYNHPVKHYKALSLRTNPQWIGWQLIGIFPELRVRKYSGVLFFISRRFHCLFLSGKM